jgi:hypothetical protein
MCTTTNHSEELRDPIRLLALTTNKKFQGFCRGASIDLHALISADARESRQKKISVFRAPNRRLQDETRPSARSPNDDSSDANNPPRQNYAIYGKVCIFCSGVKL